MSWLSFIIGFAIGLIVAGAGLLILIKCDNKRYHKIKRQDK
jgi:hypothetical protein